MLTPQQSEVKVSLMQSAVQLAHLWSPVITTGSKPEDAEAVVATQVERWYQWLLQAYKDETVFHSPEAATGTPSGAPLVSALIAAIPGLDPATKALLASTLGPLLQNMAGVAVQAASGVIPLPPSSAAK